MELYLDSADVNEIDQAFELGYLTGLTTTPTFMHRHGITDIDGAVIALSKKVPILQIEALGTTSDEIIAEAKRQDALGLDKKSTVYKIPMSLEGTKACKALTNEGFKVNLHLVYTLQQAYMAMAAGATYICPLVGRLQDQGTDALALVADCVEAVEHYGYDSKIMFSSVRNAQHVRDALEVGAHAVTVPWSIMKNLTNNHLTTMGTDQFVQHTNLLTHHVGQAMRKDNPTALASDSITTALVQMTTSGLGACSIIDENGRAIGIFTDGDLRRFVTKGGNAAASNLSSFVSNNPKTIASSSLLIDAEQMFKDDNVDTIIVEENGVVVGMIDIQDLH